MRQLIKFLIVLLIGISTYNNTYSQHYSFNTLYFCEGVDENGYPISPSKQFKINSDGGYLYLLFKLYDPIGCYSVKLKAYRNDTYVDTYVIDVKPEWNWFWKYMEFYSPGKYTFYLYDCDGYLLVSESMYIEYR